MTNEGIRVGSSFGEVKAAYPEAEAYRFPGLWEEPSCIVEPRPGRGLCLFFPECTTVDGGGTSVDPSARVIRLVVRTPP